jgi:UDP-glucose 4-epimerase
LTKRILVTGGAGFIGSALVRAAVARGARVTVLDDLSTGSSSGLPEAVPLIEHDVADGAVADVIASVRPDIVIHAAAQVSVTHSIEDPRRDHEVNVDGTRNVIAGAAEGGAGRIVFISSGGAVYGEADGATEETPPAPESPYGANKLAAEALVAASGLSYANARLSNVYGPGQRAGLEGGVVAIFMEAALRGASVTIFGDGSQMRDFVYVGDVVNALLRLAESELSGTWNVATGTAISVHGLLGTVGQIVGREIAHVHEPARVGEVYRSRLGIERIATDLGWRPTTSLERGLGLIASASAPSEETTT